MSKSTRKNQPESSSRSKVAECEGMRLTEEADQSEASLRNGHADLAKLGKITDKLMRGLDSQKVLFRSQEHNLQKLQDENKRATADIEDKERQISKKLKGSLHLMADLVAKEANLVKKLQKAECDLDAARTSHQSVLTQIEQLELSIQMATCSIHFAELSNDKMKALYIRNEKRINNVDRRIRNIREEVKGLVEETKGMDKRSEGTGVSKERKTVGRSKSAQDKRNKFEYNDYRKYISNMIKKNEQELQNLQAEHKKMKDLEAFMKKKLGIAG